MTDAPQKPSAPGEDNRLDSGEKVGIFSSLRLRNFNLLLLGTTLSNAAQWVQQVTLNWLAYDLTGSGMVLGSINAARSIPSLSLTPVAGVIIDRVSRRALLLMIKGWLFLISLVFGFVLISGTGRIAHLFIFALLGGLAQTFDASLRQVLVFDLVPRRLTPNAVALIQTGWSLMRSLGPGIGGFLILWFGPGGNFLIQAAAYALIAISVFWIQFPPQSSKTGSTSPLQNIREGIMFVAKNRVTLVFMMMGWALPLLIVPNYTALPPIYAKDVFHGGPETLGFLMAVVGVGGIFGGIVVASLGRMERRGLLQLVSLLLTSLTLIGFAFSTTLPVALAFLALSGFFEMIYLTTNQTLIQLSIPDNLRGRVTSIVNLNAVLSPLGAFAAGAGSDLLGGPKIVTIVLCSIAAVVAIVVFFASPTVRNYRLSQAMESD